MRVLIRHRQIIFLTHTIKVVKYLEHKNNFYKRIKLNLETSPGNIYTSKLTAYDHFLAISSSENITKKIFGGQNGLKKYLDKPGNKQEVQLFVRMLFQYVTSRDPKSARFLVAK